MDVVEEKSAAVREVTIDGPLARFLDRLKTENKEADMALVLDGAGEVARIVEQLGVGHEIAAAAAAAELVRSGNLNLRAVEKNLGKSVADQARELGRLGQFGLPASWRPGKSLSPRQAEALRQMLLAVAADVRLVVARLAQQLQRLRSLKDGPADDKRRTALETREIYAPLASRLGIWQLKWELEDLAFRFLEPDVYKRIAQALKETRSARQTRVETLKRMLNDQLSAAGITAAVQGRPKHIYSISRKMLLKKIEFERLFDIHAARVLVDSISDCYAALGVVHSTWTYIPGEFDDYIATPKDNLYRSLHTAVIGPDNKPFEIQIRTRAMHTDAELGIAAHWRYKEGRKSESAYEQKISWLRRILEPADSTESAPDFLDRVKSELFEDRVYAISPAGDVVDLPAGATPIDFAYHIHTDVGHQCRGAKVNGRMVPLTYQIRNGDQVDIITARSATPSRDWLISQLGYLASSRSRAKVRNFFRRQDRDQNRRQGRNMLERELQRLGIKTKSIADLATALHRRDPDDLYQAIGEGETTLAAIASAIQRTAPDQGLLPPQRIGRNRLKRAASGSQISVKGVGNLLTHFARCCGPVPPEAIAGYITLGRGVTIHREDCSNLLRLQRQNPERLITVDWTDEEGETYPVDIRVEAHDRHGLVRDVSTLLAEEKINILGMTTRTDQGTNTADIDLSVEVHGLDELSRLLHRLSSLPNVTNVKRKI